ncbi:aminopeptidase P N-terminal domain-containing protein [Undibacterium crateris]|uniref:aminopeptidase P N-terminal domain-containing protein n=1 Tax=Undibacterium crateris TaxID=2528175 RepID=UPI001389F250|nr:aminopeptidase P N-terminal domain-containing protein [Undibacterium crateris]NDI86525.1 M24 family metallopeptidase [Undibacterium crateris]
MSTSSLSLACQTRRQQLMRQMQAQGGGVAVIPTAQEMTRNNDNHFPFRHDSYFYYLTGFCEPEAVLVLIATAERQESILFCREKNIEHEIWDGYRYGPEAARQHCLVDAAYPVSELAVRLEDYLAGAATLYTSPLFDHRLTPQIQQALAGIAAKSRTGIQSPAGLMDVCRLIDEMRLFKDAQEIACMQEAARISGLAHRAAMRAARPGLHEYALEAELLYCFRRHGAQAPAYSSIVASGANACTLHYQSNQARINDGDLILIDAGCEFDSYASDITRTFPANGRFSPAQKTLYQIVLAAQQAALACAQPGAGYMDGHHAAVRVLTEGMLDTGLLRRQQVGTVDDAIASQAYRQFYMHGTGHWLGLDVHDVGDYRTPHSAGDAATTRPYRPLQPGMVITIEPGLYVRPAAGVPEQYWNTGIRIEDDILITASGHQNLSQDTPKTINEIEAWMRGD